MACRKALAAVSVALTASLPGAPEIFAHPFPELRQEIVNELEWGPLSAFSVAVFYDGRLVWEEGFGFVDEESGEPVTPDTPFSLASVSKPLTATALMVLVQRGEIDLDLPIGDYLGGPRLTGHAGDPAQATVRRVASHTAGLPVHFRFYTDGERRPTLEETVARYGVLVRPPGSAFQYSNLGYRLLERVLEVATGRPFAEVLQQEVFAPLGMTGAVLASGPDDSPDPVPQRIGRNGPLPNYGSDHPAGSDIYASANDLVRFAALHLGTLLPGQEEILNRRSRQEMWRPATRAGRHEAYGIGWLVEPGGVVGSVVGHTGSTPGTSAALFLLPQRRLAVAALAASDTDLPQYVARQVLERYRRGGPVASFRPPPLRLEVPRGTRPSRRLAGDWTGVVAVNGSRIPLALAVARDGSVRARFGDTGEQEWGPARSLVATRFGSGRITAWLTTGGFPSDDLPSGDYWVRLALELEDGRLTGTATALGVDRHSLPFALAHWVELDPAPPSVSP